MATGENESTHVGDQPERSDISPVATHKSDRPGRGRPTLRTPEIEHEICEALALGMSRTRTAQLVGITYETLKNWCKDDEDFFTKCKSAEAFGVKVIAETLRDHTRNPSKVSSAAITGARFYLSTHDREEWTEKTQIEHSGSISISDVVRRAAESSPSE